MKFNKKERSLCRKIAEKHRKDVEYGDWFEWGDSIPIVASGNMRQRKDLTPLWTISDCLEFLMKLKSFRAYFVETYNDKTRLLCVNYWDQQDRVIMKNGKTTLEACLKAVLAVLEETK